ncbi:cytochrome d ubiquinol oxidase subunit I [Agrilactobacillus composti DSM 18527 = JCM 14202]|nr:cytochrome ubiquinol oxidase subunit I [Agrilactobacillus composti]GAF39580.1 cytochrome d ubiquinol oxidase subunit I [Agrilactobacillus composti DSM 18527 = JCM 14202]
MALMSIGVLSLARWQFAMTTVFHFFFVPFSIGMAFVVAIMETMYVVKKNETYKKMAQFWGKIFLLSFAVGVVTGIIQEFQFGMNWSNYSRFMGDIFGAPLAIEALLAFFMESVFIGVWMFTWNRFKPAVHVWFIWLTMIGSMCSAIWILAANSFMQHPTGFAINQATGRVKMTSFADIITNPQLWKVFPHVITGAILTAATVVVGIAAFGLLRKHNHDFFKKSMRIGLWISLFAAIAVIVAGDFQTQQIIKDQPMKFAATEGVYKDTGKSAPWTVIASFDTDKHETKSSIEIPKVLSLLAYHKTTGSVQGMNSLNQELHAKYDKKFGADMNYYVPVKTVFWSFRVMAGGAALLLLTSILGLFFTRKNKDTIENKRWLLWVLGICTYTPFVFNSAGWLITELGRYPWLVYGLQTIADGVSPTTTAGQLWFTNIVYFLMFSLMGAVMVFYSRKIMIKGPDDDGAGYGATANNDPFSKEAFGR